MLSYLPVFATVVASPAAYFSGGWIRTAGALTISQDESVHLLDAKPAFKSGATQIITTKQTSIGGKLFNKAIRTDWLAHAKLTFALPQGMHTLKLSVGIDDARGRPNQGVPPRFTVLVDGNVVAGNEDAGLLKFGQKPSNFKFDITNKKAVQFLLEGGADIGDPICDISEFEPGGNLAPKLTSPA